MPIVNPRSLDRFLDRYALPPADGERVAIFDCDYTMILGDIGESMLYRQIMQFHFRRSPADVWPDHPDRAGLDRLYRKLEKHDPAARVRDPEFGRFADQILDFYFHQLEAGAVEKGCADIVRLFAGYTRQEVQVLADETFDAEIAAPPGRFRLGSRELSKGIRFTREMVDLLDALTDRGFVIWAISGSNKWSVEPVFRGVGVPRERVIGIDLEERNGVFTEIAEEPIPIRTKKIDAFRARTSSPALLCASDSRNDIPLLLLASELRVYVNSHGRLTDDFFVKGELRKDDSWVVVENPTPLEGFRGRG